MTTEYCLYNGIVILPEGLFPDLGIWVRNGTILHIGKPETFPDQLERIDAAGSYISPGFIDLHVHGGGGFDFMDGTLTAFQEIAATHARFGTTAMMPTTVSCSPEELQHLLFTYQQAVLVPSPGASFIGLHLEGPYLNPEQRGAQDIQFLRLPDPDEYEPLLQEPSPVRRWSFAPELTGSAAFLQALTRHQVLPALAHSDAYYDEVASAATNGMSLVTHLYSGMSGVRRKNARRYPGAIEAALLLRNLDVELIADGMHVPGPLLELAFRLKGAERIALITDAMRAAGTADTVSRLGSLAHGLDVIIEEGVAKLPDRSSFAGSIATADRLLKTMATQTEATLLQVIQMMSSTPARIAGIAKRKGSLEVGKDADIVLFDNDYRVKMTIVSGKRVYDSGAASATNSLG